MNKDIRLSVGFFDHPKIIKLERKLGLEGVTALLRLWLWAAQNRPSGVLSGMDVDDIEIVARWNGVANDFYAAITSLKLLDCLAEQGGNQTVYAIHDWQEHNAWQSDAENRSNASRLSRMAKTHPSLDALLEKSGIKGISRENYALITSSNAPQSVVERLLAEASSPFPSSPLQNTASPFFSSPHSDLHGDNASPHAVAVRNEKTVMAQQPVHVFSEESAAYALAKLMRDTLKAHLPTLREPDLQQWAQVFDDVLKHDERMSSYDFVAQVITWACSHSFWRGNIQHPKKLQEKFDQLTAKMELEMSAPKSTTSAWVSPATRRAEANAAAAKEAEHLLFGKQRTEKEVIHES